MIPYERDEDGLRDWRPSINLIAPPRRPWPWLFLLFLLVALVGLGLLIGARG